MKPYIQVLIADKDLKNHYYLKDLFSQEPQFQIIRLVDCESIQAALNYLQTTELDLVLLNLDLNDSNGIASYHALRKINQVVPIIVMSEKNDQKVALEIIEAGAEDYLHLPSITSTALRRIIYYTMKRDKYRRLLRENEERVQLIFDNALDAIISTDAMGTITAWNKQAEYIFGWKTGEILDKNFPEVLLHKTNAKNQSLSDFFGHQENVPLNTRVEITAHHQNGQPIPVEF